MKRFWDKVDKNGPIIREDLGPCWIWTAVKRNGYGRFRFNGRVENAHRVSLKLSGTHIPDDMFGCHKCDNPSCVNPSHLFVGTRSENALDMVQKDRQVCTNREKTHCKRGHELAGDNLIVEKSGSRKCRECKNITWMNMYRRRASLQESSASR